MTKKLHWALVVLSLSLSACATMMTGETQKISVSSAPVGVTVTAQPGGYTVTTPAQLTLRRERGPYTLTFSKEGYRSVDIQLNRGSNGWVWGNLFIGGLIGVIVDYSNGSAYKLTPEEVHANLSQLPDGSGVYDGSSRLLIFDKSGSLLVSLRISAE